MSEQKTMPFDAMDIDDLVLLDKYLVEQGAPWYHAQGDCNSPDNDRSCGCHSFIDRVKALVDAERARVIEECAQIADSAALRQERSFAGATDIHDRQRLRHATEYIQRLAAKIRERRER